MEWSEELSVAAQTKLQAHCLQCACCKTEQRKNLVTAQHMFHKQLKQTGFVMLSR